MENNCNTYPNNKIEELNKYVENFENDINSMKDICEKINNWTERGIDLVSCHEPLNLQIESWKNTMNDIIEIFSNNILELKQYDDRISNEENINLEELSGSNIDKWSYLYNIYEKLYINLNKDIDILNNVINDLSKYNNLGVKLGNVNETINQQIDDIKNAISISLSGLEEIINKIKEESKKVLEEGEIIDDSENEENTNVLALYTTAHSDANTFYMYMHNNLNISWNPEVDGKNMEKHVTKVIYDSKSPLYDAEKGSDVYLTNTENQYKHLYYGYDKNDLIHENIDDTDYGILYADQSGYSYTINFFYSPLWQGFQYENFKNLMATKGQEYLGGQSSSEKLFVILSTEEISDFSGIKYRGE